VQINIWYQTDLTAYEAVDSTIKPDFFENQMCKQEQFKTYFNCVYI
jgi:hypothetical protein